ncbi:SDR family oxidoreductase [Anaerobacillus sp. MEB173]|uniref:SDR family oxidoreductase n=1 Tax=Anaerobacillus sp. MEB173 TaxID=3383345 RepID=UPI003F91E3C5
MKKTVLLTGTTGFLGKDLLHRLVHKGHHIYVLIREKRGQSVEERLHDIIDNQYHHQITIITGDVTKENLGLKQKDIDALKGAINTVIHSAGLVRFDQELKDELFKVNYYGTKNLISFAKQICVTTFYYISTAYTIGKNRLATEELQPAGTQFHNPYEESKALAEYEVANAQDEQFKTAIFRPSIIVGDSETGEADTSFTLYGYMRGVQLFQRKFGKKVAGGTIRIIGDPEGTSNLVPVNYVCNCILAAFEQGIQTGIYHLTSSTPFSNKFLFTESLQLLDIRDFSIELIKGLATEELTREEKILHSFVQTYENYLHHYGTFDDSNMQRVLAEARIPRLNITKEMYGFIVKAYMDKQFVLTV